jgi:peptidyl-dipeptidase A
VPTEVEKFITDTVEQVRPLEKAFYLAEWEAAASGTAEANERQQEAQAAYMRFWADAARYASAKRLHEAGAATKPLQARQITLIYLNAAKNQQDDAIINELTRLEAEVRTQYYTFRGQVRGRSLSDNELETLLRESRDNGEVQEAWRASKQVGVQVSEALRALARVRNVAAHAQGFRDHFQRALTLDEIDEGELLDLFQRLDQATLEPFRRLKATIDARRAERFGIKPADLAPWHYGDRFFQEVPRYTDVDVDGYYSGKDPVALATATYDGLGMEVRDILARSDLYARPGKNQHAFCTHIDREGDIRTLDNLEPIRRWITTLHHELGHAVYDKHIDRNLPWLVRTPPHTLSTEAIAILMGAVTLDAEWLSAVLGLSASEATQVSAAAQEVDRAGDLIFTRWCLVMTHFEQALYADPGRDLNTLWWDLVERYQLLRRPEGPSAPDWAAKYHIALAPVYYQNYELGHLVMAQLRHHLRKDVGGIVGRRKAGQWLIEHVFRPGAQQDWRGHVETATGEPLDSRYFVEAMG